MNGLAGQRVRQVNESAGEFGESKVLVDPSVW